MKGTTVQHILDVYHIHQDGLHEFASPQIPDFYINSSSADVFSILAKMAVSLANSIESSTGCAVHVVSMPSYKIRSTEMLTNKPKLYHFAVEERRKASVAAKTASKQSAWRDRSPARMPAKEYGK